MSALYVVGFLVDEAREHVVLIWKRRPDWQAGRLNGIGGKVEPGEAPMDAMAREFEEETGYASAPTGWDRLCTITWPDDQIRVGSAENTSVVFYRRVETDSRRFWGEPRTRTDELVQHFAVSRLLEQPVIPNLRWLVPLAAYTADRYEPFTVHATTAEA